MKEVKKAVIPAAGLGTRFLPITKSMPKEMLPLVDRPAIHYVVEEAVDSGIDDIIIVTGRGKRAIEDYFDYSPELEMYLKEKNKEDLLASLREISSMADIHFIRQKEPRGLGDAILRTQKHVGNEPFAVLLGDDIIENSVPCIKQLIEYYYKYEASIIAVQEVPDNMISQYGIIDGIPTTDKLREIREVIEKPQIKDAPSNIGAVGRYVFTPELFNEIKKITAGVGDEIQLADALNLLVKYQKVYAYSFEGKRYDIGDKNGYIEAIIALAQKYL